MLLKENDEMRERVEGLKARDRASEERIEMLEEQLSEANRVALDVSGANLRDVSIDQGAGALEEELARAHADIVQMAACKRELQNELLSIRYATTHSNVSFGFTHQRLFKNTVYIGHRATSIAKLNRYFLSEFKDSVFPHLILV